jgi:hypothetical protein
VTFSGCARRKKWEELWTTGPKLKEPGWAGVSVDWIKEDTSRVLQLQGVLAGEQPLFLEPSHSFHSSSEQPVDQTATTAFSTFRWMPNQFGSQKFP